MNTLVTRLSGEECALVLVYEGDNLYTCGKQVDQVDIDVTVPLIFSAEGVICSRDYGDSVDHEPYKPPFRFTGTVKRVNFDLTGDAIEDAEAKMRRAMSKQ
jgi:arylsulfatase